MCKKALFLHPHIRPGSILVLLLYIGFHCGNVWWIISIWYCPIHGSVYVWIHFWSCESHTMSCDLIWSLCWCWLLIVMVWSMWLVDGHMTYLIWSMWLVDGHMTYLIWSMWLVVSSQSWKTRWFVLYKNELTYYKTREVCGVCVCVCVCVCVRERERCTHKL